MAEEMADGTASSAVIERARELFGSLMWVSDYVARGFVGENGTPASFIHYAVDSRVHYAVKWAHGLLSDLDAELGLENTLTGVLWLRCIFGNPFRPVTLDTSWLTSTVAALARGIYADRAFDRLPILADALQDAGCDNPEILNHCRSGGPHVRGCWIVDLLLDKN